MALRDVMARLGRLKDVRRVFYTGFFEDPKHRFASSLSLSEVLETPPGHTPVFLALRLNGRPLPVERGGPVRMLVPEGYGFKSIKWLNRVVLTNDYRANDTYAEKQNNDPSSPMKTWPGSTSTPRRPTGTASRSPCGALRWSGRRA